MTVLTDKAVIAGVGLLAGTMAHADNACLLTPSELQTLTGRAFSDGEPGKNLGDGCPHRPRSNHGNLLHASKV